MKLAKRWMFALMLREFFLCGLAIAVLSGFGARSSCAGVFTLVDENSSVDFNTNSQANATNWLVDGQDQLFQQGFWYRIGNAAEQSLDTLPIGLEGTTDTNFDLAHDTLFVRYNGAGFRIEIRYTLDGGALGSGASDMGEQISVTNLGASPLDFHLFQYADFDLLGTTGGDTALFSNSNTVRQYEGVHRLTETVVTPVPSHRRIDFAPLILAGLNDGVATTLSDTPATNVPLGPGDVSWAYQWDVLIPVGGTFQVSKDKNLSAGVIPEPATLALLASAAALLLARRRKR
jgi:hypothetical protein